MDFSRNWTLTFAMRKQTSKRPRGRLVRLELHRGNPQNSGVDHDAGSRGGPSDGGGGCLWAAGYAEAP